MRQVGTLQGVREKRGRKGRSVGSACACVVSRGLKNIFLCSFKKIKNKMVEIKDRPYCITLKMRK